MHMRRYLGTICSMFLALSACERNEPITAPVTTTPFIAAVKQSTPKATKWASLSAATQMTCGITKKGNAYCWGLNDYGQLGAGSADLTSLAPVAVAGNHTFKEIAIGYQHACGIASGTMLCWGHNDFGQLGNSIATVLSRVPLRVEGDISFSTVTAGFNHTCAIGTKSGSRSDLGYCWGSNRFGQMGIYTFGIGQYQDSPQEIQNSGKLCTVFACFPYLKLHWIESASLGTCALSEGTDLNGVPTNTPSHIVCWGLNNGYVFGTTDYNLAAFPTGAMQSLRATSIELSLYNTSACAIASEVSSTYTSSYCWGEGGSGEVGDGTTDLHPEPTQVSGPSFIRISTGSGHSCGIARGGQAYCWGSNTRGQLGNGTLTSSLVPVPVSGGIKFKEIYAAGANPYAAFTCGLTGTGEAYCWGGNEVGELGDGTTVDRLVPTAVLDPF